MFDLPDPGSAPAFFASLALFWLAWCAGFFLAGLVEQWIAND